MKIKATSVLDYLKNIPEDRKPHIEKLRQTILTNLPSGFEEQLSYGMLGYVVPLKTYPSGYHCKPELPLPFINLASQKNFIALYHSGIYANKKIYDWFVTAYPKHCKYKIDMGKCCIRFKKMEDIPYDLIAELLKKYTVEEWINTYKKTLKK
ncbi:MAG: DUF1801 domain-containing protein [Flavobacteriaceae bacterium]